MCLRDGREVAAATRWNCSCCCVSGDGLLKPRIVSAAVLGYRCVAEGGESNCSTPGSSLVSPALLAPQYVNVERNSEVWVTWPLGNDAEQHQRCFQGDGKWENEESLGEAFRARRWKEKAGLRPFLNCFPCLGDSSFSWCDVFMAWRRQFALLEEK